MLTDVWAPELPRIEHVQAAGSNGRTWIVDTADGRLVAKHMPRERSRQRYVELFAELDRQSAAVWPRLVGSIDACDGWYAVFTYLVETTKAAWCEAFDVLRRLRTITLAESTEDVAERWQRRLGAFDFNDAAAQRLQAWLADPHVDEQPRTLAHGDFSAQNFCRTLERLALVDWEEAGSAPAGFDAGWLLAHNRIGSGPGWPEEALRGQLLALGFSRDNLVRFEALGLLRLLYRCLTLPLEPGRRELLARHVRGQVVAFAREWHL
jgi:aminoglycoside phosphotransferase (APT) family kinase protein